MGLESWVSLRGLEERCAPGRRDTWEKGWGPAGQSQFSAGGYKAPG